MTHSPIVLQRLGFDQIAEPFVFLVHMLLERVVLFYQNMPPRRYQFMKLERENSNIC